MKLAACVEYDGGPFCGWQRQIGQPTVQEAVETALSTVADHPVQVVTAGRTDTAVHASGQIIHFETEAERSGYSWLRGANSNLPPAVRLLWVMPVDTAFHARFSATERAYRYIIHTRRVQSAIHAGRVTAEYRAVDATLMHEGAQCLVGRNDFSSFRAAGCQSKSPMRELRSIQVNGKGEWVWIDVRADSFLYHMVRNIAGVLLTVGAGEAKPEWVREVLQARDRTRGGQTAAPDGLYLTGVDYDKDFELPASPPPPVFW